MPFEFRWDSQHSDEASDETYQAVRWSALLDVAKELSGDAGCDFDGDYHAGGRHIVRRVTIPTRATPWLVKIPIVVTSDPARNWNSQRRFTMESEIATMMHLASKTSIPVPEVFGYDTSFQGNPVGLPYILMRCIEGNMLFDMGGPRSLNSAQKVGLRWSIASVQRQLLSASVNKIGCPVLTPHGDVDIGQLPQDFGLEGPFTSSAGFFGAWVAHNHTFKNLDQLADCELRRATEAFPRRLAAMIDLLTANDGPLKFPIVHPDFGLHNILLNDDYEVVGVIDWEGAYSAPVGVFAARTNMFASLDVVNGTLAYDEEGADYVSLIATMGRDDISWRELSIALGSVVGALSLCMMVYEEGRAIPFDIFMDKIERELRLRTLLQRSEP